MLIKYVVAAEASILQQGGVFNVVFIVCDGGGCAMAEPSQCEHRLVRRSLLAPTPEMQPVDGFENLPAIQRWISHAGPSIAMRLP
jgi:hypothetical protein